MGAIKIFEQLNGMNRSASLKYHWVEWVQGKKQEHWAGDTTEAQASNHGTVLQIFWTILGF